MPESMSRRERVQAALSNATVDHPPASMWRHFFESEATGEGLAEAIFRLAEKHAMVAQS